METNLEGTISRQQQMWKLARLSRPSLGDHCTLIAATVLLKDNVANARNIFVIYECILSMSTSIDFRIL